MIKELWRLLLFIIIIGSYLISGCSSITPVGEMKYAQADRNKVEVLYQEPQRPYELIALISHEAATRFATVPDVIQKCRALAAQAGADAIIITSTYDQGSNSAAKASGKAIRWKKS